MPLVVWLLFDFRRSLLVYAFLRVLLNQNICLVNMPGVPLVTMELFCDFCFCAYFLVMRRPHAMLRRYPLSVACCFMVVSLFLSTVFSTAGFVTSVTRLIYVVMRDFMFPCMLWFAIRDQRDLRFVLRGFLSVFLFLAVYGAYEKFTWHNPIYDYVVGLTSGSSNSLDWAMNDKRLGMGKVRSAIMHPIGLGVILSGLINLFVVFSLKYRGVLRRGALLLAVILFLGVCVVFFTNTRSPLIFLFLISIPLFDFRRKSFYYLLILLMVVLVCGYGYFAPYFENILSLFAHNGTTADVGGSNFEMRLTQLLSAVHIIDGHYLLGLGVKSMNAFDLYGTAHGLLGAESVWIKLLVEQGILGVISYIFFIGSIILSARRNRYVQFLVGGWFVLTTVTSTPGISLSFLLTLVVLLIKADLFSNFCGVRSPLTVPGRL
jgi:hypothetical protein